MINERTNLPENAKVMVQCDLNDLRDLLREAVLTANTPNGNPTSEEPEFLTTDQTAKRLKVDRSTLWRWHRNKYLCHCKVGHKTLYRTADVERLLKIEGK